jgi:hypothetical protein
MSDATRAACVSSQELYEHASVLAASEKATPAAKSRSGSATGESWNPKGFKSIWKIQGFRHGFQGPRTHGFQPLLSGSRDVQQAITQACCTAVLGACCTPIHIQPLQCIKKPAQGNGWSYSRAYLRHLAPCEPDFSLPSTQHLDQFANVCNRARHVCHQGCSQGRPASMERSTTRACLVHGSRTRHVPWPLQLEEHAAERVAGPRQKPAHDPSCELNATV